MTLNATQPTASPIYELEDSTIDISLLISLMADQIDTALSEQKETSLRKINFLCQLLGAQSDRLTQIYERLYDGQRNIKQLTQTPPPQALNLAVDEKTIIERLITQVHEADKKYSEARDLPNKDKLTSFELNNLEKSAHAAYHNTDTYPVKTLDGLLTKIKFMWQDNDPAGTEETILKDLERISSLIKGDMQ